jgi:uncharacterized protein (DUF736 family)
MLRPIGSVAEQILASWGWKHHEAFWGREALRGLGQGLAPASSSNRPQNLKLPQREARAPNFQRSIEMSEIGRLQPTSPQSLSRFTGVISTFDKRYSVRFEGDETKIDDRAPSHRIFARSSSGHESEIGSAWLKTTKHGQNAGKPFMSITIDYPGMSAALNVAAFPSHDGKDWVVAWRRRKAPVSTQE